MQKNVQNSWLRQKWAIDNNLVGYQMQCLGQWNADLSDYQVVK